MEKKKKIRLIRSQDGSVADKALDEINKEIEKGAHESHFNESHSFEGHAQGGHLNDGHMREGLSHEGLNGNHNHGGHNRNQHRRNRIIAVACAMVFTMLVAIFVGCGLALWDMGRTPADLVAAISGKTDGTVADAKSSDEGLTFMDADSEETADGTSSEDTGLTFIDANDTDTANEASNEEGSTDGNGEATSEEGAEGTSDEQAVAAGTINEDGTIVVSAELAGVGSVMRAGADEAMTVATVSQSGTSNPDAGYPLPFTAVDDSYFEDALFIGDSRFYGFCMWSGIPGTNYCATSFNILNYETFKAVQTGNGKVPIFSSMPYNAFTKIYIKVGLNEMGTNEARFEAVYAEVIAKLRQMQPRAIIYIHGILPVTAAKSASDKTHSNPNILARNAALQQFAVEQQCYYIDASSVLSDENGCLKPEMTSDGIHLASAYMGVWKQYLMEHAVVAQ